MQKYEEYMKDRIFLFKSKRREYEIISVGQCLKIHFEIVVIIICLRGNRGWNLHYITSVTAVETFTALQT